ncbi:hypothetical protein GCM10011374_05070 [Kocuria dechangensis]|uniref:Uncharacterized protein n=1 Tax=Kocuria dechangensis TaxID=1176249 RepID=A0A917GGU4_9MICC|nr:hypothetical protein GCM10011374_05070 [Kocuria dechangensis]
MVGGDMGHMSAFTAQAGPLVVCGDAGDSLRGIPLRTRICVKDTVASRGSDCVEKEMRAEHLAELAELLAAARRRPRRLPPLGLGPHALPLPRRQLRRVLTRPRPIRSSQ